MSRTCVYQRRVTWADCDPARVWRFTSILSFVEEAEVSLLREAGVLSALYGRLPRAYVEASFHATASFDEQVTVLLSLMQVGRSSLHYQFEIRLREDLGATGKLRVVLVDKQGKPQAIPATVRQRLELWMAQAMAAPPPLISRSEPPGSTL
jgi:acyl-CoA thioesterase FadM